MSRGFASKMHTRLPRVRPVDPRFVGPLDEDFFHRADEGGCAAHRILLQQREQRRVPRLFHLVGI